MFLLFIHQAAIPTRIAKKIPPETQDVVDWSLSAPCMKLKELSMAALIFSWPSGSFTITVSSSLTACRIVRMITRSTVLMVVTMQSQPLQVLGHHFVNDPIGQPLVSYCPLPLFCLAG